MEKEYKYMLCVRCMTFNHESFIKDAMEGFVMQKTSFPYVTVIVDDASTDNTRGVIKSFLNANFTMQDNSCYERDSCDANVIFARHCNNINCYFAVVFLKENLYGKKSKRPYYAKWMDNSKYHALCEGDDYWICPDKLQQQVDFLERHEEYVLTCHRYKVYDYENRTWSTDRHEKLFYEKEGISFDFKKNEEWFTKTLSLVYRADALEEANRFGSELDYIRVYFLMKLGLGYCFNNFWGVYRRSNFGVCSKKPLKTKIMREYNLLKRLYYFDPNSMTKSLYHSKYASVVYFTHGRILFQEEIDVGKVVSILFYAFLKVKRLLKSLFDNNLL